MDNDLLSDAPEADEKVSAEVAEKPAEPQVTASEEAKPAASDDDAVEFSITGSLPEPKTRLALVIAGGVLAADFLTKTLAAVGLEGGDPVRIFGGLLHLTFVRNPGAAFGPAEGWTVVLALIAFGVAGFVVQISRDLRSQGWAAGLGLVLGGAVGNLADRLFREPGPMRGHVIDFLSLFDPHGGVWPAFNLADLAIVGGGAVVIVLSLRHHDYDGTVVEEVPEPLVAPVPVPAQADGLREAG
ncbi:signal peptidase II [Lentzea fradiae]|uniref:Lipoprotein signal peptidase n=1 Tax=Lentzea fradiae TaxID=200378 RepID=A0A1G7T7S9_9PSEU|nr:signal peptidase II [Lentzea fradiae]SDG31084.1 signal peptidase II [Lentzea fradiae]